MRVAVAATSNEVDSRQKRRAEILAAASALFAEQGFHKASIAGIIERANIARGTFYLYFSSKHAILEAILDAAVDGLRAQLERIELSPDAPPPNQQLRDNVLRVLQFVWSNPALARLVLDHGMGPDDEVASRVTKFNNHALELIETALNHGIDLGVVRKDCNVPITAAACLGAIRGVVEHIMTSGDEPDLDKITDDVIVFALGGLGFPS